MGRMESLGTRILVAWAPEEGTAAFFCTTATRNPQLQNNVMLPGSRYERQLIHGIS